MIFKNNDKNKYLFIKKREIIVAIISKAHFVCAFINDYKKRLKVKIRLSTSDFIEVGVNNTEEAREIIKDIKKQCEEYKK